VAAERGFEIGRIERRQRNLRLRERPRRAGAPMSLHRLRRRR